MRRVDVNLPVRSPQDTAKWARRAEELGYYHFWTYEIHTIERDPIVNLCAAAQATSEIKLGVACLNPILRIPSQLADIHATLEELAPGRITLGIGSGFKPFLDPYGLWHTKPRALLREAIDILRSQIRRDEVQYDGQFFKVHGVRMYEPPWKQETGPDAERSKGTIPIYTFHHVSLAFAELVGELGDGCFGPIGLTREYTKVITERVRKGIEKSGRSTKEVPVVNQIVTSVANTTKEAREIWATNEWSHHAAGMTAMTAANNHPDMAHVWAEGGMDPNQAPDMFDAMVKEDHKRMADILLASPAPETLGAVGDRESVAEKIEYLVNHSKIDAPVISPAAHTDEQLDEILEAGALWARESGSLSAAKPPAGG